MTRLLSIDWDFFFPEPEIDRLFLYDWGHSERHSFMQNGIWVIRATSFLRANLPLPLTSGEESGFWDRFLFSEDVTLYYGDSHSLIYRPEVRDGVSEIWNFDLHHDAYLKPSEVIKSNVVTCQDWATALHMAGVKIKAFHPTWAEWIIKADKPRVPIKRVVDPQKKFNKPFDKIFICRSGSWTPTWIEDKFWELVKACPAGKAINLDGIEPREFDIKQTEQILEQDKILLEEMEKRKNV